MPLPMLALMAGVGMSPPPSDAATVAVAAPPVETVPLIDLPPAPQPIPFFDLPPPPGELPPAVRKLIDAAFDADNDEAARAILRLARGAHPDAVARIDALEQDYAQRVAARAAQRERERIARLEAATWTDNWTGEVELGGSRATGNTNLLTFYGGLKLNREGLRWTHAFSARIDFQESDGRTMADRLRADWQPGYKIREGFFLYGLGQYERDRFLGYNHRGTASAGVGFTLVNSAKLRLDLLGGPALRHTVYSDDGSKTIGAGRASLAFRWQVSPTFRVTQDAAFYVEGSRNNAISTSTIETQLVGNLKARLSYDLQYEKNDLPGRKPLDTTSRATIAYSF